MPQFQLQKFEQIMARAVSRTVSRTDLSDVTDSSGFKHFLAAFSREIDEAYYQMDRLKDLFDLDKASGIDLDERAKNIQPATLTRTLSRAAAGGVIFTRATTIGTITIASGTVVKTASGILFQTTVQTQILAGGTDSVLTGIAASERGVSGNVDPGTIVKFGSTIPGVDSVTNPAATLQGRDEEGDDAFRSRIKEFIKSLARSTVDALEFVALGVVDDSGKEVIFSHLFEDPLDAGKGILYIDDGFGTAEETLVSSPDGDISDISASAGGEQTITDNGEGLFLTSMIGRDFVIAGALAANNGTHIILDVPTANTVVIDNGTGTAETPGSATWDVGPEIVTRGLAGPPPGSAVGGEEFLLLDNKPVKTEALPALTVTSSTRGALVLNTDVYLNPSAGRLYFTPALAAAEVITAEYTYFSGLISAVQKVVDGDENDRDNFPGYRAGGINIRVLTPDVVVVAVEATLIFEEGVDASGVIASAETVVSEYINNLGISKDVVRNELIEQIMGVVGVHDLTLVLPASNVPILDDEIPRSLAANISIT